MFVGEQQRATQKINVYCLEHMMYALSILTLSVSVTNKQKLKRQRSHKSQLEYK